MSADPLTSPIDAQVQAARERGDFDHLAGHGKPLELDDLSGLSAPQRLEALLLRSLGEVLPEIQLTREIRVARARLALELSDAERELLKRGVEAKVEELRLALKQRRADRQAR